MDRRNGYTSILQLICYSFFLLFTFYFFFFFFFFFLFSFFFFLFSFFFFTISYYFLPFSNLFYYSTFFLLILFFSTLFFVNLIFTVFFVGYLTFDEIQYLLNKLHLGISHNELGLLINEADENQNGVIEFNEFVPLAVDMIMSFKAR